MSVASSTSSLTPSRSPSPCIPVQPDHFFGAPQVRLPPSPNSDGRTWLDPEDDPLAHRGIPVFKPTMDDFRDFEGYVSKIECWGKMSGIVKIIPPKEWTDALPPLKEQLTAVKIKTPIEQHMLGSKGLFRQENVEKRRIMSVREWAELCKKDEFRAPGVNDVGPHARSHAPPSRSARKGRKKVTSQPLPETAEPEPETGSAIKGEPDDDVMELDSPSAQRPPPVAMSSPPNSTLGSTPTAAPVDALSTPHEEEESVEGKLEEQAAAVATAPEPATTCLEEDEVKAEKSKRTARNREAALAARAARDMEFLKTFNPHVDWLPPNTRPSDYTYEFCRKLERQYWRNCGLGRPAWYGADTQGSLYTDETTSWNVAHLPSALSRLLPSSSGLPGVNTPYLYFGMWRATFAWHVEDMDLFSINYIHFGAPKFWYAVPQGRAAALESTMKSYFPRDISKCPQFLRHKSYLASPNLLAQTACRPNMLVQQCGEFVITFPRGYHAGFNLGFNCAESVNFALDSWLEMGKKAKVCECVSDSVRIDVEQLLRERNERRPAMSSSELPLKSKPSPKKRKMENNDPSRKHKKQKLVVELTKRLPSSSGGGVLKLKLKPVAKPIDVEPFPCCLCVSRDTEGLLRVHDLPIGLGRSGETQGNKIWQAHEHCASVVPETWVDEVEIEGNEEGEQLKMEKVVFGVDGIVKARWNLKCSACSKMKAKEHGAPIQCTKGKCPKAFHVSCARDGAAASIIYSVVREVEKEVVLINPAPIPDPLVPDPLLDPLLSQVDPPPAPVDPLSLPVDTSSISGNLSPTSLNPLSTDLGPGAEQISATETPVPSMTIDAPQVLKVIKKLEVTCLCPQHNPAVAAAKKANKQDKIRSDLLALPTMSRIKIRVSTGVFEVSLLRVIEETGSVEVLWDRGVKREFKWGSVVFGSTDGQMVQQKPSELEPEPTKEVQASQSAIPALTSVALTNGASALTDAQLAIVSHPDLATILQPYGGAGTSRFASSPWIYQLQRQIMSGGSTVQPSYAAFFGGAAPDLYTAYTAAGYHSLLSGGGQYRWQQPYTGPRHGTVAQPACEPGMQPPTAAVGAGNSITSPSIEQPPPPAQAFPP